MYLKDNSGQYGFLYEIKPKLSLIAKICIIIEIKLTIPDMSLSKDTLEIEIRDAVVSRLRSSYNLSDKAHRRIIKSAGRLADRLYEIFQKQEWKATGKADEMKDDQESSDLIEEQDDLN